jgi:hypothetical protein
MSHAPRSYRLVHYATTAHVLTRTVQLGWHWDWRYGVDPMVECRRAQEGGETLEQRAVAIVAAINEEIERGLPEAGRRPHLLGQEDMLCANDRDLIRRDLLTVQVAVAMLSALAAKAVLEEYRQNRQ